MNLIFKAKAMAVRIHPIGLAAQNRVFKLVSAALVVSLLGAAYQIHAQAQGQCDASYAWSPPTTSTNTSGPASAPAIDTAFNPLGQSYSYFAQGNQVYAVRNVADADGPAGSVKWTWQAVPAATINNFPTPVVLSTTGEEVIFVGGEDGFLYKVNAATGIVGAAVDTRRPGCLQDQLRATPTVQLYNSSNADFQASVDAIPGHAGDDLVYVGTYYQCNDHSQNRVIAYWASDLSVKFIFNPTGGQSVDAVTDGCPIDYSTNTLFCGSLLQPGSAQNSLWALNSLTGVPRWAGNAGSIQNRPLFSNGRLYVAANDASGARVQAYDSTVGLPLWDPPLAFPGYTISRNLSPAGNTLLVTAANPTASNVSQVQDNGSAGTVLWQTAPEPGVFYTSMPVAVPSLGKVYLGRNDGRIQQIDLATGTAEEVVVVNPGATVFDPSLDIEGGASDFNRLVVVADATPGGVGVVTRLILPFCADP